MEMQFSSSIITAIDGLMRLYRGEFESAPVQPVWRNFRFPSSLKAGPIDKLMRNDPIPGERAGSQDYIREVEFFFQGTSIATVTLAGRQFDGNASSDNDSQWSVWMINYLPDDDPEADVYREIVYVGEPTSRVTR